ncbi:hypothetical protein KKF05_00435 [Patescibacteria group bacterium]|nr:hypothetical protein [Patescibacteria group bacterium]MBU1029230.1 hypothetical protein [Patescibacteria group bacterium]
MLEQIKDWVKATPWKRDRVGSYVRTLSLKVPSEAIGRLGDVQGLIGTTADIKTGNILSANIEEAFTEGLDQALKQLPVSATFVLTFETAVARVNTMLRRLLGERGLPIGNAEIHGTIIAQKGAEVAAAVWGKPSLILFRRSAEGGSKLIDVLGAETKTILTPKPGVGFTNLISGKISGKDRMLVANRNLLDLLDKKCLQEILSASRTDTVTMLLRDSLIARHENLDLAMLLLDGRLQNNTQSIRSEITTEKEQLKKSSRERQVEAAITIDESPAGPEEQIYNPLLPQPRLKNELQVAQHTSTTQKILVGAKKELKQAFTISIRTASLIGNKILTTAKLISDKTLDLITVEEKAAEPGVSQAEAPQQSWKMKIRAYWKAIAQSNSIEKIIVGWNGLTDRSRKLFLAAMVLLFVLNASLNGLSWKHGREEALASYEKTVSSIRQQLDSAEASMIYRDEGRARRLLEEAAATVATLPAGNDERTDLKIQLTQEVENRFDSLRRATGLDAPEVLSTVVTPSGMVELQTLATTDGIIWATATNGTVFKISEDGSAEALYAPENGSTPEMFLALSNGILTGTKDNLTFISTAGKISPQTISAGDFELNVSAATTFGSRLYLLDSSRNRILKFAAVPGGYASPQVYIKDGTDLSTAVSLAIDGRVYVLLTDGRINKLLSGKSEDFTVGQIDPPLVSPILLRTPNEKSDLYVLDAGQPRIVRYSKNNGQVVAQYESEDLRGVTDFEINQTAHTILATKGNRLLRFTWTEEE